MAGWYVDNGLLASNSPSLMSKMVNDIHGSFEISDLGEPTRLLGIKISRDRELGTIHLSQPSFINTIAKRFDITHGKLITSIMDPLVELHTEECTNKNTMDISYALLIGSINYCAISTRPDISYATNKCTQFTSNPNITHWEGAHHIVWYLLYTKNHGILYTAKEEGAEGYSHNLAGFTDSDYAGDVNDRNSTMGWVFTFNGSPISWALRKQKLVTRSSMEAEFIATSMASAEAIWLTRLGKDF